MSAGLSRRRAGASTLSERASLFAALGDRTRLRLVRRLSETGPLSISRLAAREPVSRQAVSKHLRTLERTGLVRSTRAGRERIWELRPSRLSDVRRHLDEISRQWDEAIEGLRKLVEDEGT